MNTIQDQLTAAEAANKSGNCAEAETICRQLVTQELQPEEKARALLHLSESLLRRGIIQKVLHLAEQAHSIAQDIASKELQATALRSIGIVYRNLSNYPLALEYYKRSFSLYEELGDKNGMAVNLGNMGIVYGDLSDYTCALKYSFQSIALYEALENKHSIAASLGNIGIIYKNLSDFPRALNYYHQAIGLYEELGNKRGIAINLESIGVVHSSLSEHSLALEYYHQALVVNEGIGNKRGIASNLTNLCVSYDKLSQSALALEFGLQSLAIREELGDKTGTAGDICNIGGIYGRRGFDGYNPVLAEEYMRKGIELMKEVGIKYNVYKAYKSLSGFYAQEARWQEHAEYLQKYYDLRDEVQTEEAKKLADKFAFERQIAVMEKEREVTDMLLHKFLPSPIVADVKAKEGKILVQQFNNISVLFADLVGFTKLSLSIKPEVMIEMLNFIFTKFDSIIKENGGHRIRTMGDGYFAICGAPDLVENHQHKLAKAALAMQQDIILPNHIKQELPEGTVLDIRIGLHCGEAVCGMVGGLEKWQYDAYGDTINTASRMESHGEPGKIHISEDFKNSLMNYDEFTFIPREPMFIKGKGLMNTFFLQ